MQGEKRQRQSIFPDVPRESPETDKDGNFTALWSLAFGALFQALQDNFKNEGIVVPGLSQEDMDTIENLYSSYVGFPYNNLTLNLPDISGQTVFDRDTKFTNQFVIDQDMIGDVTLAKWVPLSVMLTNLGDPNGLVSGVLNWLCYDVTNGQLYICTVSGSTTTAVWSLI